MWMCVKYQTYLYKTNTCETHQIYISAGIPLIYSKRNEDVAYNDAHRSSCTCRGSLFLLNMFLPWFFQTNVRFVPKICHGFPPAKPASNLFCKTTGTPVTHQRPQRPEVEVPSNRVAAGWEVWFFFHEGLWILWRIVFLCFFLFCSEVGWFTFIRQNQCVNVLWVEVFAELLCAFHAFPGKNFMFGLLAVSECFALVSACLCLSLFVLLFFKTCWVFYPKFLGKWFPIWLAHIFPVYVVQPPTSNFINNLVSDSWSVSH